MKSLLITTLIFWVSASSAGTLSDSMRSVLLELESNGVAVSDVKIETREPDSPLPNTYDEHISFSLPSVAPSGGQIFIFSKKKYADALYAYFDMYRQLAPYVYMSKDGLVLAQLNSGLSVKEAENFEEVLNNFTLVIDE